MAVFVTGATGFIGRHFLNYLLTRQPETSIICLSRNPEKAAAQWPYPNSKQVSWRQGDLLEPASYESALHQAETVFHLAALVGLRDGEAFYEQNTQATQSLLSVAKTAPRVKRLVFTGSIAGVDRPKNGSQTALFERALLDEQSPCLPSTDYGRSKMMAEQAIQESGVPYSILIPAFVHGTHPRQNSSTDRLMQDFIAQKSYTRFPFPGKVSEIQVDDLAALLWLASQSPETENKRFFVSNPSPVSIADVFQVIAQGLGYGEGYVRTISPEKMARCERQWRHRLRVKPQLARLLFEPYFACNPAYGMKLLGKAAYSHFRQDWQSGVEKTAAYYRAQNTMSLV